MGVFAAWFTDVHFLRMLRNAAHLFSGSFIGSVLSLIAFLLAARILGVEDYGRLAIILAFALVVERLVVFSSWQSVIRYGAPLWRDDGAMDDDLAALLKFSVFLDVSGALVAAALGAATVVLFGQWLGWSEGFRYLMLLYLITVLVNFTGMPTGLLRIAGRFRRLGAHAAVTGAFKLVAIGIVVVMGGGLGAVVAALILAVVAGYMLLVGMAAYEIRRHLPLVASASLQGLPERFPGLHGFTVSTNLNASVHVVAREGDVLLVGAFLGEAATGLYKLAKQVGAVLGRFADPLYSAIYPEMSGLIARGGRSEALGLMVRMSSVTAGLGLVAFLIMVAIGERAIAVALGPEFVQAYPVMLFYLVGMVIAIASMPMQPMMLALGHASRTLVAHAASAAFFLMLIVAIGKVEMDVIWVAGTFTLQGIVWAAMMGWFIFGVRE